MTRRRLRRALGAGGESVADQDRRAVRTYRGNRGSTRYYRDLKTIDEKSPSTQQDDTKK